MEALTLVNLLKKANMKHDWGNMSYILIRDDGSGAVISEDERYSDECEIFDFGSLEELEEELNKRIKE